jgi:hypothetical protein
MRGALDKSDEFMKNSPSMGVHPSVIESFEIGESRGIIQKMDERALINGVRRKCTRIVMKATLIKRMDHGCSI